MNARDHHVINRRVPIVAAATRVLDAEGRRIDVDARRLPRVALVAAQTPLLQPGGIEDTQRADVGSVHVVLEVDGADDLAVDRAARAVVAQVEQVIFVLARCVATSTGAANLRVVKVGA